jgi:hypothetical protein
LTSPVDCDASIGLLAIQPLSDVDQTEELPNDSSLEMTPEALMSQKRDQWIFGLGIIISISVLWLPYLRSSFWLDETGTAWIVSGTFRQTISRSATQGLVGQSPAYYVLVWISRQLFGSSEAALRLPSVIAALATVWVVYRIGLRLFDKSTAAIGALTFSALICVAFAAVDARPYAVALLTFSLATLVLIRWEDSQSNRFAIAYVLLAGMTIYLTYMFAVGLLAHVIYAYRRRHNGVPMRRFFASSVAAAVLISPALPRLYHVLAASDVLNWVGSRSDEYLGDAQIVLPVLVSALVAGMMMRVARETRSRTPSDPSAIWLAGSIGLVPPLLFLALSYIVAPKFFVHRYFLEFSIGLALFAAYFLASLSKPSRYVGIGVLLLIPLLGFRGDVHQQDWRGAARVISARAEAETPILLSGFSSQPTTDPERQGFLRAPLSVYHVRGHIVLLPSDLSPTNIPILQRIAVTELIKSRRFFLVTGFVPRPFRGWLETQLGPKGFTSRTIFSPRWIEVTEFDRVS